MTNRLNFRCLCNKEDSNYCSKCNYCIYYKYLFNADMLLAAWTNGNTPPQYFCTIFDFPNFIFYCNNCLHSINVQSLTSKITEITRNIAHANMDDHSVIIKNIDLGNLNSEYINKLLSDISIDQSSINEVNFKNGIVIVQICYVQREILKFGF